MKKILLWSGAFLLTAALSSLALYDNGQLSLVWHDWVIETSVSFALAVIVIGFIGLYLAVQLLVSLWHLPRWWRHRNQVKAFSRAENHASKGLIALEYGDWQTAEKQLLKSAKYSESGLVHYLSAAKMAHNQGAYNRRDQYLAKAKSLYPEEVVTIGLVEARLLADQAKEGQSSTSLEKALAILKVLNEQSPNNRAILAEYLTLLKQVGAWQEIELLLPKAKRLKALDKEALQQLETALLAAKIQAAPDLEALEQFWQFLSRTQHFVPQILAEYVEKKAKWGEESGLAEWIEKAVKKQWDDRLVYQYGRLQMSPAFQRLRVAQKWETHHPNHPVLLLTLGRLACMSQLWAQGQDYLKQSLKLQPEIETFHALAQCYEAEGAQEKAALTYKEAILQLESKQL